MSDSASVTLPAPAGDRVDVLIVAAEHSGDEHAARMVRGLLELRPEVAVAALGGQRLAAAGAQLLRDLTTSSAIGFAVLSKLAFYRSLITEIVRWVGAHRPRAVVFVDSSGLNLRIARGLFEQGFSAKAGGPTKTLYYISPQVWASRPWRVKKIAQVVDTLCCVLPFEEKYFQERGVGGVYVGHPMFDLPADVPENDPARLDPLERHRHHLGDHRPSAWLFRHGDSRGGGGQEQIQNFFRPGHRAATRLSRPPWPFRLFRRSS